MTKSFHKSLCKSLLIESAIPGFRNTFGIRMTRIALQINEEDSIKNLEKHDKIILENYF